MNKKNDHGASHQHYIYLDYLEKVNNIAVAAGELILKHFLKDSVVLATKEDASPLTAADLESHYYILNKLTELNKDIPIISEESPIPDYAIRRDWQSFWLVDPLDGTKEFIKKGSDFTVNIALIENGEPILGSIYVPVTGVLYYAAKGQGSWKREGNHAPKRIVSKLPDLGSSLIVVESKSHPSRELERYLKDLPVKKRITAGSSLKFCLVAEGIADIYPRMTPCMEWDVAAGDCIFRNSLPTQARTTELRYNKPSLKNDRFVIGFT